MHIQKCCKISGTQNKLGYIKESYIADLTVIDDFFSQDSTFWLTAKSYLTVIDGEIVYQDY